MSFEILLTNLTNPPLLFFLLGIIAVAVKSDLEVPPGSVKFISLYLLFSIGFKGGQELAKSPVSSEMILALIAGLIIACIIPLYIFFALKRRLGPHNSGAIAATYGSVSAVTFVSAVAFLDTIQSPFSGYMIAVMALMEFPAIIVAVLLIAIFDKDQQEKKPLSSLLHHSITNGSVLLIVGSLLIGLFSDSKQAEGIKPFTTDIFKGFLSIFLLDIGMLTARRISAFKNYGKSLALLAILFPIINGTLVALLSHLILSSTSDRFMLAILAASASYIAVPASLKLAVPRADPGMYIPMAIGVSFPFNISIGMPLYYAIANLSW